jgi:predicted nuclease with TOPRIM domain
MNYELESIYNDTIMKEYVKNFSSIKKENEDLKQKNKKLINEIDNLKNKNHELNKFIEIIMLNYNLYIK